MINESTITQLEKRARGFRRIISSLNDLPMYGINERIDKILHVKIDALKEHLKLKITRNNDKLNEMYTESVDSLSDDDGQQGTVAPVELDHHATDKTFENDR